MYKISSSQHLLNLLLPILIAHDIVLNLVQHREELVLCGADRFVHVRAHTGGSDDLSIQNDKVDRLAREAVDGKKEIVVPVPTEEIVPGCPLAVLGPPVAQGNLIHWMREHLDAFDRDLIDKHLYKAFQEMCKAKSITLTKNVSQRTTMLKAELTNVSIEKIGAAV